MTKTAFSVLAGSFILLNMADKAMFSLGPFTIHEWIILVLFAATMAWEFGCGRITFTWVDRAFFLFFVCALLIPTLANLSSVKFAPSHEVLGFYLPVKAWLVYRIVLVLLRNDLSHPPHRLDKTYLEFSNILIVCSSVAAVIGYLRIIPLGRIGAAINQIWPISGGGDILEKGRLASTMSFANGSGVFFAAITLIAFSIYLKTRNRLYLGFSFFFALTMFFTGSFAAIFGLGVVLMIFFRKYIRFKLILRVGVMAIFMGMALSFLHPIREFTQTLIEKRRIFQIDRAVGIIPGNLYSRIERWPAQAIPFIENPFFGIGPHMNADMENRIVFHVFTADPHTYYLYLLIHGGLLALAGYLVMQISLLKNLSGLSHFKPEARILMAVVVLGLVTQVSQKTFLYGGYSELFGVVTAFSYWFGKKELAIQSTWRRINVDRLHFDGNRL